MATKLNAKHGKQLSIAEKKDLAQLFFKNGHKESEICEVLAASAGAVSNWLKNLKEELKEKQKQQIIELYLQCLTQEEIAQKINVHQSTIARIMQKFISEDLHKIASKVGLTQERIAQIIRNFINEEINKINLVPDSLQLFNVWNFGSRGKT